MKMKIVVRVSMDDEKSRSKALKISVGISGVQSAALKGDEVEVIGEGIDAVDLTRQLRKSMTYAELVSVGEDKPKETPEPAKAVVVPEPQSVAGWVPYYAPPYEGYPHYYNNSYPVIEMRGYDSPGFCSIL